MQRNGKIARLPREIRDELNTRLAEGEPGGPLLEWLNGLPTVKAVLERGFGNNPITKQNLSEWRTGGFVEWEARQEMLAQTREMAADAKEFNKVTAGKLTDHLATTLAARYASLLSGWNGEADESFRQKLHVLRSLCQDVAELRRGDHSGGWLKLEQDRVEREEEQTGEAVVAQFQRWLQNKAVKETVCRNWKSPEEKKYIIDMILGVHPDWPAHYKKMHEERMKGHEDRLTEQHKQRMRELEAMRAAKPKSDQSQTDIQPAPDQNQPGVQTESNQIQAQSDQSQTGIQTESHLVQPESHPVKPVRQFYPTPYTSAQQRADLLACKAELNRAR